MNAKGRRPRHLSFLIWMLLVTLGFYALEAAVLGSNPNSLTIGVPLALLGWLSLMLLIAFVQGIAIPSLAGIGCPICSQLTVERVAVQSFGPRYFRCKSCGGRLKRSLFGSWEQVTEATELALYEPAVRESPFDRDVWAEEDAGLGAKSIDWLVRNQRGRKHSD
jgi:hypothetical protein